FFTALVAVLCLISTAFAGNGSGKNNSTFALSRNSSKPTNGTHKFPWPKFPKFCLSCKKADQHVEPQPKPPAPRPPAPKPPAPKPPAPSKPSEKDEAPKEE
ncbi:MAG: hypothetical protein SGCHY_004503, partial [Lobulomycetales sp.]